MKLLVFLKTVKETFETCSLFKKGKPLYIYYKRDITLKNCGSYPYIEKVNSQMIYHTTTSYKGSKTLKTETWSSKYIPLHQKQLRPRHRIFEASLNSFLTDYHLPNASWDNPHLFLLPVEYPSLFQHFGVSHILLGITHCSLLKLINILHSSEVPYSVKIEIINCLCFSLHI